MRYPGWFILAVLTIGLATIGCSHADKAPPTAAHAPVLPRDRVISLATVKEVLPEMSGEIDTGHDETAVGSPAGTRSVTFAKADAPQRVVISVDQYASVDEAAAAFEQAFQASRKVPGVEAKPVPELGERAFIGVVTQGTETHVGGGALYGARIVTVTLQHYDGSSENVAKVVTLIGDQGNLRIP